MRELEFASRTFETIEINGSFYSLLRATAVQNWYERTPRHFRFALKGSRFITHMKRLRDVETPLANFFASGPLALEDKLGPILWQFPPQLPFDADRLQRFFEQLPRSTRPYFDNDARVRAPFDALTLRALVRGEKPPRAPLGLAQAGEPAREEWPATGL